MLPTPARSLRHLWRRYAAFALVLLVALLGNVHANPPMIPRQAALQAFGGQIPAETAALLDASLPAHVERQRRLDADFLAGSSLRTIDHFARTLTVVRAGKTTVFDLEMLGAYVPAVRRWEWSSVERTWTDPDLKDPRQKSFVTGSAPTRLYGREHGIALFQADATTVATEEAVWYLCAFAAQLTDNRGLLVTVGSAFVDGVASGQKTVVKRYYLLTHPRP